jgi:hypothetical protein
MENEIKILEFSLNSREIDNLIISLKELKQKEKPIHLDIDNENQLIINLEKKVGGRE